MIDSDTLRCLDKHYSYCRPYKVVFIYFAILEYLDGETLIPKNTSVIIRRVPLPLCMPIVIPPVADQEKYCLLAFKAPN